MNLQDRLAAFEIRQLYRNSAIKTSRTGERRVEGFRTVGCSQDNHPVIALKAVHLRQQLVECLFALIVSADMRAAASLLTDRVDFIYKHDAGGFLLGLSEQITDFGRTHADKHFDEFRTGYREKRNISFTGHGLCEHGFAGSRRADQKDALGHGGTDFLILLGIVQVIHDLLQVFLRLIYAFHIGKPDAVRRFHIDFGIAFPHVEHQRTRAASGLVHHLFGEKLTEDHENNDRQQPGEQKRNQR